MSWNNRTGGRERVRHDRPVRTEEDRILGTLPYKKGDPTPRERACFEQLRGELTGDEVDELTLVAETLRRVTKRLRALDLIRYWGAPLSERQRSVLPLLAGLDWRNDLPSMPLDLPELVRHLVFSEHTPGFLVDPFTHPEHYASRDLRWDCARITGVVGRGEGLARLRQYDHFWTWVPQHVFDTFLATPDGVPVPQGLVAAFVAHWQGPEWVSEVAFRAVGHRFWGMRYAVPAMLRVAHSLCIDPVPRAQAEDVATRRLEAIPEYTQIFGHITPLGLRPQPEDWHPGWTAQELLTPEAFEAAARGSTRYLTLRFQDAVEGRVSMWQLIHATRTLLVQVDLESGRAFHFDGSYRHPDEEADAVIAAWARATGLTV